MGAVGIGGWKKRRRSRTTIGAGKWVGVAITTVSSATGGIGVGM